MVCFQLCLSAFLSWTSCANRRASLSTSLYIDLMHEQEMHLHLHMKIKQMHLHTSDIWNHVGQSSDIWNTKLGYHLLFDDDDGR